MLIKIIQIKPFVIYFLQVAIVLLRFLLSVIFSCWPTGSGFSQFKAYSLLGCIVVSLHKQNHKSNTLMTRCTRYNIMWQNLSATCDRSVVFSGYFSFLQQ